MTYYNEHDPKAAAWIRALIDAGHLPAGHVDTRDIRLVQPTDLVGYTQCHFFAGIGGWALALRLAGVPDDCPVWTGSCPCQPFSVAGKRHGTKDPRHLWPHFRRLIRRCRPAVVFGEQVASADGRHWLSGVFADLEALAYLPAGADLCAAGVGPEAEGGMLRGDTAVTWEPIILSAPHIRQRLWWVARGLALTGPQSARRQLRGSREGAGTPDLRAPDQPGGSSGAGDGRVDNTHSSRLDGQKCHPEGHSRHQARLQMPSAGCPTCGMADSTSERQRPGIARKDCSGGQFVAGAEPGRHGRDSRSTHGPWSAFDLIPCRDGKTRRIESGTFPLAHGVSGRVGLLRGYGNAIVPQVAAEFIQAALEALEAPKERGFPTPV